MQAQSKGAPVLIVGGGIGGLGTALALARKGIASHVIEQAPKFEEIGAGIQLGPNVFRMFEVLGLTGEMNKLAVFPQGLEFPVRSRQRVGKSGLLVFVGFREPGHGHFKLSRYPAIDRRSSPVNEP